ncbi:Lrp/AsnC family transcriptional regulator [Salinirarus marinus]|uniref:Lrp/AsnC family transcriptional regulator n=1 Tax=Salinirarus marinus TaxID=3068310 RepID=UPI003C6C2359
MVVAYIMVKANTGEADRLKGDISAIDGVTRAHIVAGDFDLVARVEADTTAEIKDIVATNLQSIAGVEDTQTYIAMD